MFGKSKKEEKELSPEEQQKQTEAAKRREMILSIACGGICLGLSFVLSQITLFKMPQGGTVTPASMLPILFFCLAFGAKKGFVVTFAFSLLQLIGGELVSFPQVMLDYIVAFTVVGVAGIFAASAKKREQFKNPIKRLKLVPFWRIGVGVFFAFILRFISHVLSGVIFWSEFAGDQNPWVYSIIYNGTFLAVEAAITTVILVGVAVSLGILKVDISLNKNK